MKVLYYIGVLAAAVALTVSAASAQYNAPAPAPSPGTAPATAPTTAATAPSPATSTQGTIQAISVTCLGTTPDACSATMDIVGWPAPMTVSSRNDVSIAAGNATRIYVPAGTLITWGNRQVPVTALSIGDVVKLDYTTYATTSGNLNLAVNTASAGTVVLVMPGRTL